MNYVRNAWYVAGWSHDFAADAPSAVCILGELIVVWRTQTGAIHALEDRCVHRLAPLSKGRCEGERLRCWYHGMLFDPDGRVVAIPGQDSIPAKARARSYPVVERHSWIWIWMGDPKLADEGLIPPAIGLDHPEYILGYGSLDYSAEARLINDNLLDFSHVAFVHENSFGAAPDFAATQARIIPLERGIRYQRRVENSFGSGSRKTTERRDGYLSYDFLVPGILLMASGILPLGTAKKLDYAAPDLAMAESGVTFTTQAVTPVTDKTSRYFFSWGPHRAHGNEATRDGLMAMADQAFAEDKLIIEAQQRVIDRTVNPTVMPSAHDRGVTLFNRLVDRLAAVEERIVRIA